MCCKIPRTSIHKVNSCATLFGDMLPLCQPLKFLDSIIYICNCFIFPAVADKFNMTCLLLYSELHHGISSLKISIARSSNVVGWWRGSLYIWSRLRFDTVRRTFPQTCTRMLNVIRYAISKLDWSYVMLLLISWCKFNCTLIAVIYEIVGRAWLCLSSVLIYGMYYRNFVAVSFLLPIFRSMAWMLTTDNFCVFCVVRKLMVRP